MSEETPEWWDESKLVRIRFASDETGWAVDMGDGTYRLANSPLDGWDGDPKKPQWGDLVRLKHDGLIVVEKFNGNKEK